MNSNQIVIERLTRDLKVEFPEFKWMPARNLNFMSAFTGAWPEFVQYSVAQIKMIES
jgi:hypothetical protein